MTPEQPGHLAEEGGKAHSTGQSLGRLVGQQINDYTTSHLDILESEAVYIFRETVAQFERSAMFFSGGKDSIVLAHLARKAFTLKRGDGFIGSIPFPLIHVDTGHNFPELLEFRDEFVNDLGAQLIVGHVQEDIDAGHIQDSKTRMLVQTYTTNRTIEEGGFDALFAGARRDEDGARAKERIFSHRNDFGEWQPRNQRPEIWSLLNGRKMEGEHFRVFPLSNWTEMDIWQYILREGIPLPSLYFAHDREVVEHKGRWYDAHFPHPFPLTDAQVQTQRVRFRTIGDATTTAAVGSVADTIESVIGEVLTARASERGETRGDDELMSMEDRKIGGHF